MKLTTISGHIEAIVAKKIAGKAASGNVIETAADLHEGEVAVVTLANKVVLAGAAPTAGKVKLVTNRNGKLRYSVEFDKNTIKGYSGQLYSAPTYKTMFIGYNGTSGDMDVTADRELTVVLRDLSQERLYESIDMENVANIMIKDSSSQADVASDLFTNMAANFNRGEAFVETALLLEAGTVTAGQAAKVSHLGKTVTFGTAVASIAVGDYLKLDGSFYKVAELKNSNKTVLLATPYQGVSGTIVAGSVKRVAKAVADAEKAGVKVFAVERSTFRPGVTAAITFNFDLSLKGFEVAIATTLVYSAQGHGTYKQIAELEYFAEGNQGYVHRKDSSWGPDPELVYSTDKTKTYKQIIMAIETKAVHTIFGGAPTFDNQITFAVPADTVAGDKTNVAILALDAIAVAGGFSASGVAV